ncbi:23424_t:CDS:2, partial [Gigaspora margarita]
AEKTENTSNNSNQEPTVQETEVVEQDIQIDNVTNLSETEKAHSSLYIERVEMSINVEPSITLSLASNKGNIALVNLMANNRESVWKPTLWKLNPHMLDNPFISKEIKDDLKDIEATSDWNYYKNELKLLTKKWILRSNLKWLEEGKKSKKYFFEQYKMRTSREATNIVKNSASPASSNKSKILQYIRDQFEALYQDEPVDIEAIEALTNDLPSVSQQQNKALIKEISL